MKTKLLTFKVAASVAALAGSSAYGQSADLNEVAKIQSLGESLVVGQSSSNNVSVYKTDTEIKDLAKSLTIFTEEQMQNQAIDSISDIIDYSPGVTTSQGEGHRDAVVFRGSRSTADFYVDGVRDDVQYYRPLYNVEKVEILRGPSALFFGRGGGGGVLNRVSKKAQLNNRFETYRGAIDSFGGTEASLDLNYALSDNVALRVNTFNETLRNHRDHYDGDRFGFNPTLRIGISDSTILDLSYEFSDHERFIDRGIPALPSGRPAGRFYDTVFADEAQNLNEFEAHSFKAILNHDFSDSWKGSLTTAYSKYDKTYTNYFAVGFDGLDTVTLDGYRDVVERDRFTLAGDLVGEFKTGKIGHKLVIGAELNVTDSDSHRFNNVFDTNGDDQEDFSVSNFGSISNGVVKGRDGTVLATGNFSDLNDDTRVDLTTFSFFLQDEIALHEKLDVVVGARFDSFDIDVSNVDPGSSSFGSSSRKDEEVSPTFGIVYKPTDRVSVYGTYSESFLPRSGEQFANINGDSERLDPDEFTNLEFGVKWNITPDLQFSAAAFKIEETRLSVNALNTDTFDQNETDIKGIEIAMTGYITDKWHITAGYTYLDGDLAGGGEPQEIPQNAVSIWNQYAATDKLSLGLGLIYQDRSFVTDSNSTYVPSYARVDASASYRVSDSLKLQLNVENLLDRDYFPNGHNNDNITVGAPINATFSVTKTF